MQTQAYTYTILLEPDEDGGFVVTCPALPGLVTHGDSLEQVREHAAEAIELYLECLQAEGSAIRPGKSAPPLPPRADYGKALVLCMTALPSRQAGGGDPRARAGGLRRRAWDDHRRGR